MSITIGSVPYLNEKPLTRWLTHTDAGRASGVEVVYAVPSRLAIMLKDGDIDAALVSSFEAFRTPGYSIVPGVSISGQGEILSVRAFAKAAWRFVQTAALDESSLTSAALFKIILHERYGSHPSFVNHAPDLEAMLAIADAGLLIGDAGMLAEGDGLVTLDLGHEWRRLAGLPFCYAVWMGHPEKLTPALIDALNKSKEWGLTQLEVIAEEQAVRLACPVDLCLRYLEDIMDYDLDASHLRALETFGSKAFALGLLPEPPTLTIAAAA